MSAPAGIAVARSRLYERGAPELQVVRREPDAHPSVAELDETLEATLAAFVDTALPGASPPTARSRAR